MENPKRYARAWECGSIHWRRLVQVCELRQLSPLAAWTKVGGLGKDVEDRRYLGVAEGQDWTQANTSLKMNAPSEAG